MYLVTRELPFTNSFGRGFGNPERGGFCPDPTPGQAFREEREIMTLDELANKIAEATRETPDHVASNMRKYIVQKLVPPARNVIVPGVGRKGEYGPAHVIGYFLVKKLRETRQPFTIVLTEPMRDVQKLFVESLVTYLQNNPKAHSAFYEASGRIMSKHPEVSVKPQNPDAPTEKPGRLRLNTKTLQRLIPIARGERPDDFRFNPEKMTADDLVDMSLPSSSLRIRAELTALNMIWMIVASIETGEIPDRVIPQDGDIIGYLNEKEIWRLSTSKWKH